MARGVNFVVMKFALRDFTPFLLAGVGGLIFDPKDFAGASSQGRAAFVYGGGADFNLSPKVNLAGKVSLGIETVTTGNLGNAVDGFLSGLKSGGVANVVNGDLTNAQNIAVPGVVNGRIGAPKDVDRFRFKSSSYQKLVCEVAAARFGSKLDALLILSDAGGSRYTGKVNGTDTTVFPFRIDNRVMARGQERFDIFCSPCHGRTGQGDGMIVQRGMRKPPSFMEDRLLWHYRAPDDDEARRALACLAGSVYDADDEEEEA